MHMRGLVVGIITTSNNPGKLVRDQAKREELRLKTKGRESHL